MAESPPPEDPYAWLEDKSKQLPNDPIRRTWINLSDRVRLAIKKSSAPPIIPQLENPIVGTSKSKVSKEDVEEFRDRLVNQGLYTVDLNQFKAKIEEESQRSLLNGSDSEFVKNYKDAMISWVTRFNGKVPRLWGENWININDDFARAKELGVQLSEGLINAGIEYPHISVVMSVYTGQKLSQEQITTALLKHTVNHEGILAVQEKLGVNRRILHAAEASAAREKLQSASR